ncbi:hypothetical protein [Azospirillum palustre]
MGLHGAGLLQPCGSLGAGAEGSGRRMPPQSLRGLNKVPARHERMWRRCEQLWTDGPRARRRRWPGFARRWSRLPADISRARASPCPYKRWVPVICVRREFWGALWESWRQWGPIGRFGSGSRVFRCCATARCRATAQRC